MGICLETERKNEPEETAENIDGHSVWFTKGKLTRKLSTSITPEGNKEHVATNYENYVKFETPKIPVIFILGGPGSGKVTHCDNLAEEKQGVIHINMTDLLQQYALENNEIKDFNQLPSKTVAEVLMLEMKMSPAAKTFLVSGYPRNMRDVVEYADKISTVNGVILLSWKRASLETQIEYGAKLGHVVLGLARMELNNFYQHVIPVAEFYDQHKLLISINGERNPAEVYNDFRAATLRIIGWGSNGQPQVSDMAANMPSFESSSVTQKEADLTTVSIHHQSASTSTSNGMAMATDSRLERSNSSRYPSIIYVVGGPGCNKTKLIQRVLYRAPGWIFINMGALLRDNVDSKNIAIDTAEKIRDTIASGQMVDKEIVWELLNEALERSINVNGIVMGGYPRDLDQLRELEEKCGQHPPIILLDCSNLQLSRGRWDDSIAAFRKRLEIFREKTLPMLKVLDTEHRLTIIDGDTNKPEVQEAFTISLFEAIQQVHDEHHKTDGSTDQHLNFGAAILQDLEDDATNTAPPKSYMNGYGPPRERRPTVESLSNGTNRNRVSVSHASQNETASAAVTDLEQRAQTDSYPS